MIDKNKQSTDNHYIRNFIEGSLAGGICTLFWPLNSYNTALTTLSIGLGVNPIVEKFKDNISMRESYQRSAWFTVGMISGASGVKFLEYILR